jgi:hypothetical protein
MFCHGPTAYKYTHLWQQLLLSSFKKERKEKEKEIRQKIKFLIIITPSNS